MKPVIVGIDPGITTGITLLSPDGKIIVSISKRGMTFQEIVRFISSIARPVIFASDRCIPPKKIEKLAATFSARLITPEHSLTREEKHKLIREYFKSDIPAWDRHQKDSLAAAIFAWKSVRSLISKIERKMKMYEKRVDFEKLRDNVIADVILQGQSINEAIEKYI
ncbi:MAG: DUF460 domain-containing protein [Candidatus Aenigmatarchaeota archaeon]